jgi:hypothetical protein
VSSISVVRHSDFLKAFPPELCFDRNQDASFRPSITVGILSDAYKGEKLYPAPCGPPEYIAKSPKSLTVSSTIPPQWIDTFWDNKPPKEMSIHESRSFQIVWST